MDFKLRFCVLDGNVLTYAKEPSAEKLGDIEIRPTDQIRPYAHPSSTPEGRIMAQRYPHGFEIFQGADVRTWYFDAGTREKLQAWVQALQSAAQYSQNIPQMQRFAQQAAGSWWGR